MQDEIEILDNLIKDENFSLDYHKKKIKEVELKIDVYENRKKLIQQIRADESERQSEL